MTQRHLYTAFTIATLLILMSAIANGDSSKPGASYLNSTPIVFSASSYVSPTSSVQQYSHLYRVNPDGTGLRQITFGTSNDSDPKWSPDGKWISFIRFSNAFEAGLYLLDTANNEVSPIGSGILGTTTWRLNPVRIDITPPLSNGSAISISLPGGKAGDEEYPVNAGVSSDGRYKIEVVDGEILINDQLGTNKSAHLTSSNEHWTSLYWISPRELAGLTQISGEQIGSNFLITLHILELSDNGSLFSTERQFPITAMLKKFDNGAYYNLHSMMSQSIMPLDSSSVWPFHPDKIIIQSEERNSTPGEARCFLALSLDTGKLEVLQAYTFFISFSPDGRYFLTAPRQKPGTLATATKLRDNKLWSAPLVLTDSNTGRELLLTSPSTSVGGIDWRR